MSTATLSADDREFLARPLLGFLTVAGGPQPPQPRPIWFEATTDGRVQFFTLADAPKLRHLRRDPRASLVVAAPADERERWVAVAGHVTEEVDGAEELASRLADRYWDLDDRADDLAAIMGLDKVRVVLHPDAVRRYGL